MYFVATVVVYDLVWIWQVVRLPTRVPTRWSPDGTPLSAISRTQALAQSAILGLAVITLVILVALAVSRLPGRALDVRRRLMEDIWALGAVTMAYLSVTEVIALPDLRVDTAQMTVRFGTAAAIFVLAMLGVLGWAVLRRRKRLRTHSAARPSAEVPSR